MPKVLILAFFFPPIAASGSLRPAGIARHLPEHGFQPLVLAAQPESVYPPINTDDSLDALIHKNLDVHRLPYRNTLQQLLAIRDRLRLSAVPKGEGPANNSAPQPIGPPAEPGLKDLLLDRLFIFPDHQKYWAKPVMHWVKHLAAADRPDVILATANPWSSLLLAQEIAHSLQIPWVADFRDPWFRNPKPQPNARLLPLIQRREAAVVQSANHIIANTESLAESLRADHPQAATKITAVTNGYARELMPEYGERTEQERVELCHFGSVYPLRNPKTLLLALAQLASERNNPQIRLRLVGGWDVKDSETDRLAESLEKQELLAREASVPRDLALRKMGEASHLLILQQDFPLQIPAKLYEYVATGRPIVAIGGPGATRSLIDKHGLGVCCADDIDEITALLRRLLDERDAVPRPSSAEIDRFEYRQISAQVADVLRKVIT